MATNTLPAHTPKYKRLTSADLAYILKLHARGVTQVDIAQRVGCDQASISRWLSQCEDSTKEASAYLKGSALRMAKSVVEKGQARDHVQALRGLNVLEQELNQQVHVTINGMVLTGMSHTPSPQVEVIESETLQIPQQNAVESDK